MFDLYDLRLLIDITYLILGLLFKIFLIAYHDNDSDMGR